MRTIQDPHSLALSTLHRIQSEYSELLKLTTPFSLLSLFNDDDFQFDAYCQDFMPHPNIGELKKNTINFGEQYGILLPNAEHYITCAMFLFPTAPMDKIILLSKNYAIDFYLNDTMGREAKPTDEEKRRLYEIRDRLASVGDDLEFFGDISLAEKANLEILSEISRTSPASWFKSFLKSYLYHIDVAHKSYDIVSLGYLPSIEDYINFRCHISGMPHTVSLIEYSTDNYLDWELLSKAGIATELQKINLTVSLVGALTNDFFSFEKEVIDNATDSNLIPVLIINNFRMKLLDAIRMGASIIRDLLADYAVLLAKINGMAHESSILSEADKANLQNYLRGLKSVLQACWMWQSVTKRYKRNRSIWEETAIDKVVAM